MFKWFKKKGIDIGSKKSFDIGFKDSLIYAFPFRIKRELEKVIDILPFDEHHTTNYYNQEYAVSQLLSKDNFVVDVDKEKIQIPYRVYLNKPQHEKIKQLNQTQKDIFNCIYSRHHNGRIRQESLENLNNRYSYWITPYRIQLLGEYVYEIIETLSIQLDNTVIDNCKRFLAENPTIAKRTKDRIVSYYGIYYSWNHPKFKDYLGKTIFDQIDQKYIGLDQEEIIQIGIDDENRLFLTTKEKSFSMIYRLAKGINWDNERKRLISTPIKEWSKYKWYLHILNTIYKECNIELIPTRKTEYINLDRKSKNQIKQNKKRPHNKV